MKPLLVVALALLVLAAALSNGWDLAYKLAYALFALVVAALLWSVASVRWLWYRHEIRTPRAQVGGRIEERLTIENATWLPKLWLEIRDHSTLSGRAGNRVVALGAYARRTFSLSTLCTRRGEYAIGPVVLTGGDPFGLFKPRRRLEVGGKVIVYPAVVELPSFGRVTGELPGGNRDSHRTQFATPNAAGVREYQPGDSLSRIHWLSSARQGRLMAKEFELDPLSEAWLVLDLHDDVQLGEGDYSTEEWMVSVAAAVSNYFIRRQRELGLITQGRVLTTDRGERQLQRALELLAVLHAASNMPLEQLMAAEASRFTRGATLVVVTPSVDHRWLAPCRMLRARGVIVAAVLLEAASFGGPALSSLLLHSLVALGIQTYLVKRGDDLAQALATPAA